jgi:pSer/pThr/pTyr-binding forkhead associated (FHA) protein
MGRGHESEVRVNDISVSRTHAIIKYQADGIYIEDNRSKFGTLVLLKDIFPLEKEFTYAFQIGRTVVSFTVRDANIQSALTHDNRTGMIMAPDFNQGVIGGSSNMMSKSMVSAEEQMHINQKMTMFQSSLPSGLLGGSRMSNFDPDAGNN